MLSEKKTQIIYDFEDGNRNMREILGGKGAQLAEMTRLALPVPPGFVITTNVCRTYMNASATEKDNMIGELKKEVRNHLDTLEAKTGKKLGSKENPLLVSVRSGAPISMPGMMDTVLNLGINDETVEALAASTNPRFAWDCYRRFIQMFGDVVLGITKTGFDKIIDELKEEIDVELDSEVSAEGWKTVVARFKHLLTLVEEEIPFEDPFQCLMMAIEAVLKSWNNKRAITYRRLNNISHDMGTAVNVQAMVFGNTGPRSGTGVVFTRDPSTGENVLYGEWLPNAQGEDVVAGVRTPHPISDLHQNFPEAAKDLEAIAQNLEEHFADVQDMEFTIQDDKLFILQTRTGKRTAAAAVKILVDYVHEGRLSKEEALLKVQAEQITQLLHPYVDPKAKVEALAKGLPASPGAASGKVVLDPDKAEKLAAEGQSVILVRQETTPDDIHGVIASKGVLTSRGGMTSHAAVVARGMGKPCIAGCSAIEIDEASNCFRVGDHTILEGSDITIDGSTGEVIEGEVSLIEPELTGELAELLNWADDERRLQVLANADTPEDARQARKFGAQGIGLARTEHMFFGKRLPIMQKMILAENKEERMKYLEILREYQIEDFRGLFSAMAGYPVSIRLLDPPLHEFLPDYCEIQEEIFKLELRGPSQALDEKKALLEAVDRMRENNPMLGLRGVRLGLAIPEIYTVQIEAILRAAIEVGKDGPRVLIGIMVPLVSYVSELRQIHELIKVTADRVFQEYETKEGYGTAVTQPFGFGAMIELPRACLIADKLAEFAQFLSFGTNDLTQTTLGFSRDDAEGKFLPTYIMKRVLKNNPFFTLDQRGVGELMRLGVERARRQRPSVDLGICGEHGGEPYSIDFAHRIGLDYVSCSPYRIPIARLAAAQAIIRERREHESHIRQEKKWWEEVRQLE
ncbi:MAG: pyruvate, phosphate dikinase [Candidatus Thorarchaeota archaeon]